MKIAGGRIALQHSVVGRSPRPSALHLHANKQNKRLTIGHENYEQLYFRVCSCLHKHSAYHFCNPYVSHGSIYITILALFQIFCVHGINQHSSLSVRDRNMRDY